MQPLAAIHLLMVVALLPEIVIGNLVFTGAAVAEEAPNATLSLMSYCCTST